MSQGTKNSVVVLLLSLYDSVPISGETLSLFFTDIKLLNSCRVFLSVLICLIPCSRCQNHILQICCCMSAETQAMNVMCPSAKNNNLLCSRWDSGRDDKSDCETRFLECDTRCAVLYFIYFDRCSTEDSPARSKIRGASTGSHCNVTGSEHH